MLQVDGRPVRTTSDLRNRVALVPVSSQVLVQVWRDRQSLSLQIQVEQVSVAQVAAVQQPAGSGATPSKPGASPNPTKPSTGQMNGLQLSDGREGVVFNQVAAASSAHQAGLRSGDVILAVNRLATITFQEFESAMAQSGIKTISILKWESKLRLTLG